MLIECQAVHVYARSLVLSTPALTLQFTIHSHKVLPALRISPAPIMLHLTPLFFLPGLVAALRPGGMCPGLQRMWQPAGGVAVG